MARFIFITGGVVSSIGKGLTTAALGALLQAHGYSVRLRKLDPYLNIDPGTMSPYEHGEVFVTDDGAETDLDLGHYERFTGANARKTDSVSAGQIYWNVLEKERQGREDDVSYVGKTIQVIPHVTDEIKKFIAYQADSTDFMLCEIGGTVGDIEGLPFFEAARQFALEQPLNTCVFIHMTLVPYIKCSDELKTKPTQHSVKELRSIGLIPNILLCRSEQRLPDKERKKIALFCSLPEKYIISAQDLESVYQAPLQYHQDGLDKAVLNAFNLSHKKQIDLTRWQRVNQRLAAPQSNIRIALIGKYTEFKDAYKSITEALVHGGIAHSVEITPVWIDAEQLEQNGAEAHLGQCHAILIPGGFGKRGSEGKIQAVRFAREHNIPYLGICLGMQVAVIEAARNLAGIAQATSEEFAQAKQQSIAPVCHNHAAQNTSPVHIVYHMSEWQDNNQKHTRKRNQKRGGTMRLGSYPAILETGSKVAKIYGKTQIEERHRHRYEIDIAYRQTLEKHGFIFSGLSPDQKLPEIIELTGHPWFIGVQFHPELKSRPFAPHPLIADFVRAAYKTAHKPLEQRTKTQPAIKSTKMQMAQTNPD